MTDDEQLYIDRWPMFEEAYSKFPVLADVAHARNPARVRMMIVHRPSL
jgi:hypothetical protein